MNNSFRKLISLILSISFMFSLPVHAETTKLTEIGTNINTNSSNITTGSALELQEVDFNDLSADTLKFDKELSLDKNKSDKPIKDSAKSIYAENKIINKNSRSENTDPNNAYLLNINEATAGSITAEGQERWYGTVIDQKTKLTMILQLSANTDYDLYIYKLDENTMILNNVAASLNSSAGASEIIDYIADEGVYYFLVDGYSGTGQFELFLYGATKNISNEINDTVQTATSVSSTSFSMKDAIDNPLDYDYYKAVYNHDKYVVVNFTKPAGTDYVLRVTQDGTNYYYLDEEKGNYLSAGTYYYLVYSPSGMYNEDKTYTLNITSTDCEIGAVLLFHSKDMSMIFQKDSMENYYVNGNLISYDYYYENVAPFSTTTMKINSRSNSNIVLNDRHIYQIEEQLGFKDAVIPAFVQYHTTWSGSNSNRRSLILTVYNVDVSVKRTGDTYYLWDGGVATVMVDVDTGEVFDMCWPNYYYSTGNFIHECYYVYENQYKYNIKGEG